MKKMREWVLPRGKIHELNLSFKKMKLTVIFSMLVFATFGNVFSQVRVSLQFEKATIQQVFKTLEDQTDFIFLYKDEIFDQNKRYSVDYDNAPFEEVLKSVCVKSGVDYEVRPNGQIILTEKDSETALNNVVQQKTINGVVTDQEGLPLPGVSIVVKGTTIGTVTNADGEFSLAVPEDAQSLQFSFVGMRTQDIPIEGKTIFTVVMEEETIGIEEVVAVGYGSQSLALITGSIGSLEGTKISRLPVANINQAIATFVPSVTVSGSASETPGSTPTLRIRGESSINEGAPLVLVDGVPANMSYVNPEDVESFTILKDASSTAIYGARGSGGVILITTKRSKLKEKVEVSYSGHYGVKTPTILPKLLDGKTYLEGRANAELAAGISTNWNHPDILAAIEDPNITEIPAPRRPTTHFDGTASTDWINEVLGSSNVQQHNIFVEGGGKLGGYRASVGYLDEDAIYRYGDFGHQRYNSRMNFNTKAYDLIDLNLTVSFTRSKNDQPVRGWHQEIRQMYNTHINDPIKWSTTGDWGGNNGGNPIHDLVEGGHNTLTSDEIFLNFDSKIQIAKGFTFNGLAAYRITQSNRTQDQRSILRYSVQPGVVIGKLYVPNQLIKTSTHNIYKNYQGYFTFRRSFNDAHNLKLLAGGSYEDSFNDNFSARRQEYFNNDLLRSLDLGSGDQYAAGTPTDWAIGSFFGRLNYDFNYKYLFEASFRYDGSSRFMSDYRWGFFPSISAGWRIKQEEFLNNVNWLSDLKLRFSWGEVGNQSGIGLYDYVTKLSVGGDYPIGNDYSQVKWVSQNSIASPIRSWETIETINGGLDYGFLNNRLFGSFEYYVKYNKNMLVPVDIPAVIGFSVPTYNSGELKVRGWEAMLSWKDKVNDFLYGISISLHDSRNEITRFDRSKDLASGTHNIEGYSLNSFFGYRTDGYFQSAEEIDNWAFQNSNNAPGDVKYIDLDDSGKIDSGDLVYLGNPLPRYNFTVNLEASWKNFDFEAIFEGVCKKNVPLPQPGFFRIPYPFLWPVFEEHLDYWTEDNRDAMFPRLYNKASWNYWNSDRVIWNAAFARLKNIQIGYTLPEIYAEKIFVSNLRIYLNGMNLLTFDDYIPFLDPELTSATQYPVMKNFSIGLNLTF
jgi:TonB-linked SusC/RagA family outer membrane protein